MVITFRSNKLLFFICFFQLHFSSSILAQQEPAIIPKPVQLKFNSGTFTWNAKTIILTDPSDTSSRQEARLLAENILRSTGIKPKIKNANSKSAKSNFILLQKKNAEINNEEYTLTVTPNEIKINYSDLKGCFYGIQTLFQLFPDSFYSNRKLLTIPIHIPCCEIIDYPRYSYRGMHLDVARHFFPVDFIKKYIDLLALHKMNTFHWHLTDDQGWRIEIKKYPLLTSVGSLRKESMIGFYDAHTFDGIPYRGYYTQEEIKAVVKYASERFVTIIPEIEMPGHARAALAAYPELGCTPGPVEVATEWGVFNEVFCPTEKTLRFLKDVLSEVCDLFPGKYIHIGGDECPKVNWRANDYCQQLIRQENLKGENELQSYFIMHIENFLSSKGKKLIGWDEILEGGLAPQATVMSWRGIDGGIAAARLKHDVIMTPGSHCYFDHYQSDPATEPLAIGGYTTVQKVYAYEPTPVDSLTAEEQKFILGAQGNLWSEYITSTSQVEYMAYPRACALAEVLWSPKESRNWDDFSIRLLRHFKRLDYLNVNYAKSIYDVTATIGADTISKSIMVSFTKFINGGHICYTTDNTIPTALSSIYTEPVKINENTIVRAQLFDDNFSGKILSKEIHIHKATAFPYTLTDAWKQYDGSTKYALTDGVYGILNQYNTWVGFSGKNLDAIIDLQKEQAINKISVNFYNKDRSWIFLPVEVEYAVSLDGKNFESIYKTDQVKDTLVNSIVNVKADFEKRTVRYIKVFAKSIGKCPLGHPGEGHDAWMFADEIVVE